MRPITIAPQPLENGVLKIVADYQDWRQDLMDAYGPHCAYCNAKLPNSANVEHEVAQSLQMINPLQWSNLLLACGPCNIAKTNTPFTLNTHFLPSLNNTQMAFAYTIRQHQKIPNQFACIPIPHPNLQNNLLVKAENTLADLKLQRVEQVLPRQRKATDIRWKNRYEAYLESNTARKLWDTLNSQLQINLFLADMRTRIFNTGFFSLWYIAFQDVPVVLPTILATFPNTNIPSFPVANNYQPVIRIAGDL